MNLVRIVLFLFCAPVLASDEVKGTRHALGVTLVSTNLCDGQDFGNKFPGPISYTFWLADRPAKNIKWDESLKVFFSNLKKHDIRNNPQELNKLTLMGQNSACVVFDADNKPIFLLANLGDYYVVSAIKRQHDRIYQNEHDDDKSFCYIVPVHQFPQLLEFAPKFQPDPNH